MTTIMSAILLHEKISGLTILGTALILAGLILTEKSQARQAQAGSQDLADVQANNRFGD